MNYFNPLMIIIGWGFIAFILLLLATFRARAIVEKPILRSDVPSTTCRKCRLPFHKSSFKCGRCGAFMRSRLVYFIGRGIIEPLLTLLIVPWILLLGLMLSAILGLTSLLIPRTTPAFERLANLLGSWIAPTFARWVPQQWHMMAAGTVMLPNEVDVPVDTVIGAALTLGTCLLEQSDDELVVRVPKPTEETLQVLRKTPGKIQEVWGYISDGHYLVPTYSDKIVEARSHGDDLLRYVEGFTAHLEIPLRAIEVSPINRKQSEGNDSRADWKFLIRREPPRKGAYPVRWEIHAEPDTLLKIEGLINDLSVWDSLPCELKFG